MKSLAIISEYNPCHKGHAYQIEKARELSGSDIIIALMSGNFVQRGIPAVFDKYTRAGLAVLSCADIVIELPDGICHFKCRRICILCRRYLKQTKCC